MRSKLQRKIGSAAKKTIETWTKELDSSSQAESLKAKNFQIPPPYAKKDLVQQLREMHGRVKEQHPQYHNENYAALINKVVPLRKDFGKCTDKQAKIEMAKEEFQAWNGYLEKRKEELEGTEFVIPEHDYSLLKENFDRFKVSTIDRSHQTLIGQENPEGEIRRDGRFSC